MYVDDGTPIGPVLCQSCYIDLMVVLLPGSFGESGHFFTILLPLYVVRHVSGGNMPPLLKTIFFVSHHCHCRDRLSSVFCKI